MSDALWRANARSRRHLVTSCRSSNRSRTKPSNHAPSRSTLAIFNVNYPFKRNELKVDALCVFTAGLLTLYLQKETCSCNEVLQRGNACLSCKIMLGVRVVKYHDVTIRNTRDWSWMFLSRITASISFIDWINKYKYLLSFIIMHQTWLELAMGGCECPVYVYLFLSSKSMLSNFTVLKPY